MAKKSKIDYLPLFQKYEQGELTATQIAKEYNVSRTSFLNCYKKYKENLEPAINDTYKHLDKGLTALQNATAKIKEKELEAESLKGEQRDKALREAQANRQALLSSLDILERHHGELARATISVVGRGIKKANELLELAESANEYNAIMSGLKSSVDMIGLFPKSPLVAIQNNINANADKKESKPFEVKVNFLNKQEKKQDESEIIDVETE